MASKTEERATDTISIEEFVERMPEWNFSQYLEPIKLGNKTITMIGVKGANYIAYKCGISIPEVEIHEETPDDITVLATSEYRGKTDWGVKRQAKKGSSAPMENAISKARRNAILAQVPEKEIIAKAQAKPAKANEKQQGKPVENQYTKAAAAIEAAHKSSQVVARDQKIKDQLELLGIDVNFVFDRAKKMSGDDTDIWGVKDWQMLEHMLTNPEEWELGKQIEDSSEADEEVDEDDAEDDLDEVDEEPPMDESDI